MLRPEFSLIFLLSPLSTPMAARIDLEAYASGFEVVPIAVVAFLPDSSPAAEQDRPWEVIADDLEFCGRFAVTRSSHADSALFASRNVALMVGGSYRFFDDSLAAVCRVSDAQTAELIFEAAYVYHENQARALAHRFANRLIDLFFGERGPFESLLLLVRDRGPVKNVFVMDYDGRNMRQLTHTTAINLFPCFVDTTRVLWVSYLNGKPDIFCSTIQSGHHPAPCIYSRFTDTSPAYSPIEGRVVYASSREDNLDIYTCDIDGANRRQLTFGRSVETSPCWSPEGYQIAFISDRTGQPQVYVMDSEGVNVRRLTFKGSYQDSPAWSPRGDQIAYTSLCDGSFDIWVVGVDGADPRQVTAMQGRNEYPAWSPDGSYIAFQSTRAGRSDIYAIRPDGTGLRRLTDTGDAKMPDWSPF